jgi:molecular chaperone GrpE
MPTPEEEIDKLEKQFSDDDNIGENTLENEVVEDAERIADLEDSLRRERAEFINYKNRTAKDLSNAKSFAVEMLLFKLMPVLDEVNRAKEAENFDKESPIATTLQKLEDTIKDFGVTEYAEIGDEFDPLLHQAVMNTDSPDADKVTIQGVIAKGYKLEDKVLRPAQVVTVSPIATPQATETTTTEAEKDKD